MKPDFEKMTGEGLGGPPSYGGETPRDIALARHAYIKGLEAARSVCVEVEGPMAMDCIHAIQSAIEEASNAR